MTNHIVVRLIVAACLMSLVSCSDDDEQLDSSLPSEEAMTATCASLEGQIIAGVTITDTQRYERSATLPTGVCRVLGTRAPFLDIEVDVPDNWSGRLVQQGGGGFDGAIPSALTLASDGSVSAVSSAIAQHVAIYAASNGGNRSRVPEEAAPGVWASGSDAGRLSADDYAYQALGTTVAFAKAIARAFYERTPSRTYFQGCSNGGRNAYIAAQRWPEEYDGIVSGCETMDMAAQLAAWMAVASRALTPAALSAPQYSASFATALAACDANDGIADGVMAHPRACGFNPDRLECGAPDANPDPTLCLSSEQVSTLQMLLSDTIAADGSTLYSRYSWADFSMWAPRYGGLGGGFALLATDDASWLTPPRQATYDFARDYPLFDAGLERRGADHDKQAIANYIASGGKLLAFHGGSDNLLSPNDHARNFAVMTGLAQRQGLTDPRTNARLFIVPGAGHGPGGGFTEVDWLSALINWVESNSAPTQLTYRFTLAGAVRTLPVCENPSYPRYNGTGDRNLASSYVCTAP